MRRCFPLITSPPHKDKLLVCCCCCCFFFFCPDQTSDLHCWNPCIKLAHPHVSCTTLNHKVCVVKMQVTDARLLFWDNVVSLYWECRSLWEQSQETKHMHMFSTHMRTFFVVAEWKNYDCNRFPWSCFKSLRERIFHLGHQQTDTQAWHF